MQHETPLYITNTILKSHILRKLKTYSQNDILTPQSYNLLLIRMIFEVGKQNMNVYCFIYDKHYQ